MTIAVDTRYTLAGNCNGAGFFTAAQLIDLATAQPNHRFVFIAGKKTIAPPGLPANATLMAVAPETTNGLLLQYWYAYKLPALLRKEQASVFLAAEGICPERTRIPQCLFIADTSFIGTPAFFTGRHPRLYKKNTGRFLEKARAVITHSNYSRTTLLNQYGPPAEKTVCVPTYADPLFKKLSGNEKEIIKNKYSEDREFFLAVATGHANDNLLNLLKAFSFFKKRQKSNMQLLILGDPGTSFLEDLRTYKFRGDVRVLPGVSAAERAAITGAAYALVYPVLHTEKGQALVEAMQCGIPVVASETGAIPEILGNAGIVANPVLFEDIAQKMMQLYKEEDLANQLAQQGLERSALFSKSTAGDLLWKIIKNAANG